MTSKGSQLGGGLSTCQNGWLFGNHLPKEYKASMLMKNDCSLLPKSFFGLESKGSPFSEKKNKKNNKKKPKTVGGSPQGFPRCFFFNSR